MEAQSSIASMPGRLALNVISHVLEHLRAMSLQSKISPTIRSGSPVKTLSGCPRPLATDGMARFSQGRPLTQEGRGPWLAVSSRSGAVTVRTPSFVVGTTATRRTVPASPPGCEVGNGRRIFPMKVGSK